MDDFEPKSVGHSLSEIIPKSESDISINEARRACESTVEKLSDDVNGVGPTAAERYLLRYEYGFGPKRIAEKSGVSQPTITNQTSSVLQKIIKYPRLARILGQFRAKRADLVEPLIEDHPLYDDEIKIESDTIHCQIGFYPGSYTVPYSWKFALKAERQIEDKRHHLLVDYIVDDETGVLLKRSVKGVSYSSWRRSPYFQRERAYTVYPLPNVYIPNEDGTLIEAIEYHSTYDLTQAFTEFDWGFLELYAKSNTELEYPSAGHSLTEVLLDRIRRENTVGPIFDYSSEVHVRNNIEMLLRLYPLANPSQLPIETIRLLWNGSPRRPQRDQVTADDIEAVFETSRIMIEPGERDTYR